MGGFPLPGRMKGAGLPGWGGPVAGRPDAGGRVPERAVPKRGGAAHCFSPVRKLHIAARNGGGYAVANGLRAGPFVSRRGKAPAGGARGQSIDAGTVSGMSVDYQSPLRLRLDREALLSNYRWLREMSAPGACGAVIKANAYSLGAPGVMDILAAEGCRDFFVATWAEVLEVEAHLGEGCGLSVLHGVREADMAVALASRARPVLNSAEQIARWKAANGGPCDVMIDTGMNRLGLGIDDLDMSLLDGLEIDTLVSHLVAPEEEHHLNDIQRMLFADVAKRVKAKRRSLSASAGICRGKDYAFDLTRPGIALYGGVPHPAADGHIRQVVTPQVQVLQRRTVRGGESVGYGATFVADRTMETATIHLGYADGYSRVFSNLGAAQKDGAHLPVIGRISMDLVTLDVSDSPDLREGDWVDIDYDLPMTSMLSGLTQYELLTQLGRRFERLWF